MQSGLALNAQLCGMMQGQGEMCEPFPNESAIDLY